MSLNSTHPFLHQIRNPRQAGACIFTAGACTFRKMLNFDLNIFHDKQAIISQKKLSLPLKYLYHKNKPACVSIYFPASIL